MYQYQPIVGKPKLVKPNSCMPIKFSNKSECHEAFGGCVPLQPLASVCACMGCSGIVLVVHESKPVRNRAKTHVLV